MCTLLSLLRKSAKQIESVRVSRFVLCFNVKLGAGGVVTFLTAKLSFSHVAVTFKILLLRFAFLTFTCTDQVLYYLSSCLSFLF